MTAAARVVSSQGEVAIPRSAFEHRGFRAWVLSFGFPEAIRPTFYRGEVLLDMSPESIESHNKVKGEIASVLWRLIQEEDLGEPYVDGVLLTHERAGVSTEPDFAFASWDALSSGRVRKLPRQDGRDHVELVGSPDLVVEVVSDSSVRKDTVVLHQAYARARIREYWLVDARGDRLRFDIFRLSGTAYRATRAVSGARRSVVLGRAFVLARTTNRVGGSTFRLSFT